MAPLIFTATMHTASAGMPERVMAWLFGKRYVICDPGSGTCWKVSKYRGGWYVIRKIGRVEAAEKYRVVWCRDG